MLNTIYINFTCGYIFLKVRNENIIFKYEYFDCIGVSVYILLCTIYKQLCVYIYII